MMPAQELEIKRLELVVEESLLSEEALHVAVWNESSKLLGDTLIGEARVRLDKLVAAGGAPTPMTLALGRPGRPQRGVLSVMVSYEDVDDAAQARLAAERDAAREAAMDDAARASAARSAADAAAAANGGVTGELALCVRSES